MNIYVGNLPYAFTDADLRQLFEKFGEVSSAKVIMDRDTNRSKGFGFVEMPDAAKANDAIAKLNKTQVSGRELKINEAQPRDNTRRPPPSRY
jgi:RNA recognition motif-containing protein